MNQKSKNQLDKEYEEEARATVNLAFIAAEDGIDEHFAKYGAQRLDVRNWACVITEEWGEVVADINKGRWIPAKKEIGQTIACLVRLWHEVDREIEGKADAERSMYGLSE